MVKTRIVGAIFLAIKIKSLDIVTPDI